MRFFKFRNLINIAKHKYFLVFGGIFFISILFWTRFLRKRAIGSLDFSYTDLKFYIYVSLICLFTYLLVSVIIIPAYRHYFPLKSEKSLFDSYPKINKAFIKVKVFFNTLSNKVHKLYYDMLEAVYMPLLKKHLEINGGFWTSLLSATCESPNIHRYIYLFYFSPPCIISATYFIETVIFNKITYFPYVVLLMIFPIATRVLIYSLRKVCDEGIRLLYKAIDDDMETVDGYIWAKNSMIAKESQTDELLKHLSETMELTTDYWEIIKDDYQKFFSEAPYKLFFKGFAISCWLSSFSYLLFKILH